MPSSIGLLLRGYEAREPVAPLADLILFQHPKLSGFQAQLINYEFVMYLTNTGEDTMPAMQYSLGKNGTK